MLFAVNQCDGEDDSDYHHIQRAYKREIPPFVEFVRFPRVVPCAAKHVVRQIRPVRRNRRKVYGSRRAASYGPHRIRDFFRRRIGLIDGIAYELPNVLGYL